MNQSGIFEGKILGNSTKLRTEHSTAGGSVTVLGSYAANLIVTADQKWICDVADPAKLAEVGDTWIHITKVGSIDVVDGWMAVKYHGTAIVTLTIDQPASGEIPPVVPPDMVVVNSLTLDLNAAHEIVGVWVNNNEYRPYPPVDEQAVG